MKISTTLIAVSTATLAAAAASIIAFTPATPALAAAPAVSQDSHAAAADHQHLPKIVDKWARAWNGTDPRALGSLFTANGVYIDYGVNKTSTGREQVTAWKAGTDQLISGVHIKVLGAFRSGDNVAIETIYSGQINGAPHAFAVNATTILELRDGKIASNRDNYSLATLLAQSGLPADWTPPTAP